MGKNRCSKILFITLLIAVSNVNSLFAQNLGKDYTFCYGSIALTLYDGGSAKQVKFGNGGTIIKSFSGRWTAYGSPNDMPGQTIKISLNGETFSYVLIRDGNGTPSLIFDSQGRKYNLCKQNSSSRDILKESEDFVKQTEKNQNDSRNFYASLKFFAPSEFVGYYRSGSEDDQFDLQILKIPYIIPSKGDKMDWSPNEKKESLKLTILRNGTEIFNGISISRYKRYDGCIVIEFIGEKWTFSVAIAQNKKNIEFYPEFDYNEYNIHITKISKVEKKLTNFNLITESTINNNSNSQTSANQNDINKQKKQDVQEKEEQVFYDVEERPEFPGGNIALQTYLTRVHHPDAQGNGTQGLVRVTFIVNKDGSVSNAEIARGGSLDASLCAEALLIVSKMPKWKPGRNRGVPVRVSCATQINFKLQ